MTFRIRGLRPTTAHRLAQIFQWAPRRVGPDWRAHFATPASAPPALSPAFSDFPLVLAHPPNLAEGKLSHTNPVPQLARQSSTSTTRSPPSGLAIRCPQ